MSAWPSNLWKLLQEFVRRVGLCLVCELALRFSGHLLHPPSLPCPCWLFCLFFGTRETLLTWKGKQAGISCLRPNWILGISCGSEQVSCFQNWGPRQGGICILLLALSFPFRNSKRSLLLPSLRVNELHVSFWWVPFICPLQRWLSGKQPVESSSFPQLL